MAARSASPGSSRGRSYAYKLQSTVAANERLWLSELQPGATVYAADGRQMVFEEYLALPGGGLYRCSDLNTGKGKFLRPSCIVPPAGVTLSKILNIDQLLPDDARTRLERTASAISECMNDSFSFATRVTICVGDGIAGGTKAGWSWCLGVAPDTMSPWCVWVFLTPPPNGSSSPPTPAEMAEVIRELAAEWDKIVTNIGYHESEVALIEKTTAGLIGGRSETLQDSSTSSLLTRFVSSLSPALCFEIEGGDVKLLRMKVVDVAFELAASLEATPFADKLGQRGTSASAAMEKTPNHGYGTPRNVDHVDPGIANKEELSELAIAMGESVCSGRSRSSYGGSTGVMSAKGLRKLVIEAMHKQNLRWKDMPGRGCKLDVTQNGRNFHLSDWLELANNLEVDF